MATIRVRFSVPSGAVWSVLADATRYADWVVGARHVREIEGNWPEVGSRLHHMVGAGPLEINDHTEVVACEPGRLLRMEARLRPVGVACVELTLTDDTDGTVVTMTEWPLAPFPARVVAPLLELALLPRNRESLRRLERLASSP